MSEYTAEVTQWGAADDTTEERSYSGLLRYDALVFTWGHDDDGMYLDHDKDETINPSRTFIYNPQGERVAWSDSKDAPAIRTAINKAIHKAHRLCWPVRDRHGDPTSYLIDIEPDKVLFRYGMDDKPTEYQRRQDGSAIIPEQGQ